MMVTCLKCGTQCADIISGDGLFIFKAYDGPGWPSVFTCSVCCKLDSRIEMHNFEVGYIASRGGEGYEAFAAVNESKFGFVQLLEWLVAHTELQLEVPDMFALRTAWIALEIPAPTPES